MKTALFLCLVLSAAAQGEDLESLLGGAKAETGPVATQSPLVRTLETLLPAPTADQSLFIRAVEAGDWKKALIQYGAAFEGTPLQKTPNGRALYALAHFKAGLPVTGLELLFSTISQPRDMHPDLRKEWKDAAPESHPAWQVAQIKWNKEFTEIFPAEIEFRVLTRDLAAKKDTAGLLELYNKLPASSPEKARVGWRLVIAYSGANKVEDAAKMLAQVLQARKAPVSHDLMNITAARLLYQRGFFAPAIKYYEKVPRTSEYWADAQEEIAWAYVRRGEPQNAVATSRSLMHPAMATQAAAESSFVHALGLLKICDYAGVLTTLAEFPRRFKLRSEQLKQTAQESESPRAKKAIDRLQSGRIAWRDLGPDAGHLPRLLSRDLHLSELAVAAKHLNAEAQAADLLFSQTMSTTGLQGYFDRLKQNTEARARRARADAQGRVKELAAQEVTEIREILRKLHIVEAEVIQQMAVSERAIAGSSVGSTGSGSADSVKFPADGEDWFDEVGSYKVDVQKSCRGGKKGRST